MRLLILLLLCALPSRAQHEEPYFAITYNPVETLAFVAANKIWVSKDKPKLVYLPFHLDGQMRINNLMGISFGLVYRYENYHDDGPLYSASNNVRAEKIWTNYHELFLLAGPRFSFLHTGIDGFYVAIKGGIGGAYSPNYSSLSLLAQPEIGYAFSFFGNPGFRLELGIGVLGNLPFYETVDFAVPWKTKRRGFTPMGVLVHQAIPIINVGIGVSW